MLKKLLFLIALGFTVSLSAQELQTADLQPVPGGKFSKVLNHFSVTATAGTGYYHNNFADLKKLSLGELTIQFKATPMFSFGLGTMGAIQNDRSYFNNEGVLIPGCNEDDGDDDGIEEGEGNDPNDIDNIEEENQDGDQNGCDDEGEFEFGDNLMGNFTFHLPGKFPFFIQAATGYSFSSQNPAYSMMVGYNQKLIAGLGIMAGVRYSNLISAKNYVTKTGGVKAELGLSWNF